MTRRRPGRRRSRRRISAPPGAAGGKKPAKPAGGSEEEASPPAEKRDPMIGRTVGRCRIEARIGQGRTSTVYSAHHEAIQTTVAVKILLPSAAANPELVERFETEARAIAKIDNENVLRIYDVGTEGKLHYIVMELLDGEEILDIITRDGRFDVMDALRVARQSANGLAAAHARNIVHRDVKPQNLVLLEDGTVKVVDFGLAGVAETAEGRVGTPHFMAPETCRSGAGGTPSDIYSLGITLYHLLIGEPPYAGKNVSSILKAHMKGDPLRPERRRPGLPSEVSDLVRNLTVQDPEARPTAGQILEAIDGVGGDAMQEKATLKRRRRRRGRVATTAAARESSSGALLVAVFLVVGAIVALVALGSTGGDDKPKKRTTKASVPTVVRPSVPSTLPPSRPPPSRPDPVPDPSPPPPEEDPGIEASRALFEAEQWARNHWHSDEDNERVVENYRLVRNKYPGTAVAKEIDLRIREIREGTRHAHPDRTLTASVNVEAMRAEWNKVLPEIEKKIGQHAYIGAKRLIPAGSLDGIGALGKELAFWRGFLTHLIQFKTSLAGWVPKLADHRREVATVKGSGTVEKVTAHHLTVLIDGKKQKVLWTDVEPKAIASLARAAFQDAPPKCAVYGLAFAFAHRLWEAFWAAEFDVGMDSAASEGEEFVLREYKRRLDDRRDGG